MHNPERRYYTTEFETRAVGNEFRIAGHAAVFNKLSKDLGGFVERVMPGAFKQSINAGADVRALFNHDASLILGRSTAGTLKLSEDRTGLAYEITLPDTTYGRDLMVSVERGDITQSSFGFYTVADSWEQTDRGYPLRNLEAASIHDGDVSPVTYPAYPDSNDVAARALGPLANRTGVPAAELLEALRAGRIPGMEDRDSYTMIVNNGAVPPEPMDDGDEDQPDAYNVSKEHDMGLDGQSKPGMPVVPLSIKALHLDLMAKRHSPS